MHLFTSITSNYLPKARVLAHSVKRLHPDAVFHLVLSDQRPSEPPSQIGPFDTILTLEDLPIPNRRAWAFKHTVVELCTAVKGPAAQEIMHRYNPDHIYYLDPDIVVLSSLDGLEELLDQHSILLTPHVTEPAEDTLQAIIDGEICVLKHGIYNLGFLGVRPSLEGQRFLKWWTHRLLHFCYADIPEGLFTAQRWVDLAPVYFPDLGIVRDPQYNVATWNVNRRKATGTAPYGILVENRPLCFFHFSGVDSGAQEFMLHRYGSNSPVLWDLRRWYLAECERMGQVREGNHPCFYDYYDDGTPVGKEERRLYRSRPDVEAAFPDPYATEDLARSFRHWYQAEVMTPAAQRAMAERDDGYRQLASMLSAARCGLEQWRAQTSQQAAMLESAERMLTTMQIGRGHSDNAAA